MLFLFTFFFYPYVNCFNNSSSASLKALIQDFALNSLVKHRSHSGVLYKANPPSNLSGIEISVVRLRSRRFWKKGANFSQLIIPPRTTSIPHVKRLALIYQDLGNWSSYYYNNISGYSLITSVIGFMVFDASNSNISVKSTKKLGLKTMGEPIQIYFPNLNLSDGKISREKCVAFFSNGTIYLSEMSLSGVCYTRDEGYFSVVTDCKKKQRVWYWWVIGFVVGFVGLVLVCYVGLLSVRLLKTNKIQIMERQADEDLVLSSRWVGGSKMPSAAVTRTLPVLETTSFL